MNQKIEWYQEVLDLEPASRVFFPLARLQVQDGQNHAAVKTLLHGLENHPEHVEARLLLIDILFQQKTFQDLLPQVERITTLFGRYPGFWSAWADHLRASGEPDAAMAMAFFSACLRGEKVTWGDVIQSGLQACLAIRAAQPVSPPLTAQASVSAPAPASQSKKVNFTANGTPFDMLAQGDAMAASERPKVVINTVRVSRASSSGMESPLSRAVAPASADQATDRAPTERHEETSIASPQSSDTDKEKTVSVGSRSEGRTLPPRQVSPVLNAAPATDVEEDDATDEEPFTLHTRSMADLLTEQGDFAGALRIYEELLGKTADSVEAADLQRVITDVREKVAASPGFSSQMQASAHTGGKARLMSMLDTLARRLEAKGGE